MKARIRAELEAEVRAEMQAEQEARVIGHVPETIDELIKSKATAEELVEDAQQGDLGVEGSIHVHFVDDGFTILGKVWYKGEELVVSPGTPEWDEIHDRNGNTTLLLDEWQQMDRYGRRLFAPGPWGGRGYDVDDPSLTDEDRSRLAALTGATRSGVGVSRSTGPSFLRRN